MHPLDTETNSFSSSTFVCCSRFWEFCRFYQVVETELIIRMLNMKKIASYFAGKYFSFTSIRIQLWTYSIFVSIFSLNPAPSIGWFFFTWIISIRSFSFWSSESPRWWKRSTGHCTASNHTRAIRLKSVDISRKGGNFLKLGNFSLLSLTNFIFSKLSHSF